VLLALAATAYHACRARAAASINPPDLIVGHGVLGRLMARLAVAAGATPWSGKATPRADGADGLQGDDPDEDTRRNYHAHLRRQRRRRMLDTLISRLAPGARWCWPASTTERLSFSFPQAFMREAQIRAAAEWQPPICWRSRRWSNPGACRSTA
jgi:3-hydroxyethyl bacteriochlorophyllide a dehydrogenase